MTAAWRLVPTDPFRARTRNPALALAVLAHLMLLGALGVSALLRIEPVDTGEITLPTILYIALPPPPLEPIELVPVEEKGQTFDVRIPRAAAPPPRGDLSQTLPDLPDTGRGPDISDLGGSLPPGLGPIGVSGPGGVGPGDGEGPGVPDGVEDGEGPLPVGGAISRPTLLHKVEPEYPTIARLSRIPGNVTVQAVIGRDGAVEDAEIVHSSNQLFDDAALEAVRQWRYAPATRNGNPVRVTFRVHVEFVLN